MYLGFSSPNLDQNQITDYLTRVVQPKLSAVSGVQRADILGDRTFAMRVWLKPDRMAALGISPSQVRDALAKNNYLSALGSTKGSMVSVNLVANTDLQTAEEFRQLVVKEEKGVVVRLGEIADVVLGAENYDSDVRFNGQNSTFMGIWVLPTANSLDVIARVREADEGNPGAAPGRDEGGHPLRLDRSTSRNAIDEVFKTLTETLLIVIVVIFLFLGSVRSVLIPVVAIPISLVGAVVPDARGRLHDQPADAARDRPLGRARRGRRDRRWWRTWSATSSWASAVRGGARGRRASWWARSSR